MNMVISNTAYYKIVKNNSIVNEKLKIVRCLRHC